MVFKSYSIFLGFEKSNYFSFIFFSNFSVNFKKNEKEYQADKSEVLKFLREEESGTSTPGNITDYYMLAQMLYYINDGTNPFINDGWYWF